MQWPKKCFFFSFYTYTHIFANFCLNKTKNVTYAQFPTKMKQKSKILNEPTLKWLLYNLNQSNSISLSYLLNICKYRFSVFGFIVFLHLLLLFFSLFWHSCCCFSLVICLQCAYFRTPFIQCLALKSAYTLTILNVKFKHMGLCQLSAS